ncbi:hypothetical protein GCU56_11950 [Geodermatophilus sabuli]|uniref:Uncharacterized protein n=1 Tax=Geodermatophilus sabuli TaxID=1564158 RepID=A0A7K3W159_9ACTN|nr:hypothetical protein [Geodermatophilus sabuli]NEK58582.1 hypothetical protein [Geodermatophilus sabuli]
MILAAGLLVLLGLGLFVGGLATGLTALYWGCVAACALAAVLLLVARRSMRAGPDERAPDGVHRMPAEDRWPPVEPTTAADHRAVGHRADDDPGEADLAADDVDAAYADDEWVEDEWVEEGRDEGSRTDVPTGAVEELTVVELPPAAERVPTGAAADREAGRASPGAVAADEPGEEDVEFSDLLLVVDLTDDVVVVDEHPRYHLAECPQLYGRAGVALPLAEARADGFTPCATCRPVRRLADDERSRRRSARLD